MSDDNTMSEPDDRHPRTKRKQVFALAELIGSFGAASVKLLDVSEAGARIALDSTLHAGDEVWLTRGEITSAAQVVWVKAGKAGLKFLSPVCIENMLGAKSQPSAVHGPSSEPFRIRPVPALTRSEERKLTQIWGRS